MPEDIVKGTLIFNFFPVPFRMHEMYLASAYVACQSNGVCPRDEFPERICQKMA